jgi:hypothetical protein
MKSPAFLVAEFLLILAILAGVGVHQFAFPGGSRPDRPVLALTGAGFWGGTRINTYFVLYADGLVLHLSDSTEAASWQQAQLDPAARDELLSVAHRALLPVRNCFANLPALDGPAIDIFLRYHSQVVIGGYRGVTRHPSSAEECEEVTALWQRLRKFDAGGSVPATRLDAKGKPLGDEEWIRAIQSVWPGH